MKPRWKVISYCDHRGFRLDPKEQCPWRKGGKLNSMRDGLCDFRALNHPQPCDGINWIPQREKPHAWILTKQPAGACKAKER